MAIEVAGFTLRAVSMGGAVAVALLGSAAQAEDRTLQHWERGEWRVALVENVAWNMRSCRVWTGGDGDGTLAIHVGYGGSDASVSYEPVSFRRLPSALAEDDGAVMNIDHQPSWIADEMELMSMYDEWDILEASASLSNYLVAETVQAFRAGDRVDLGGVRHNARTIYDSFSLTGFTATWLKASEWCDFHPDTEFSSS